MNSTAPTPTESSKEDSQKQTFNVMLTKWLLDLQDQATWADFLTSIQELVGNRPLPDPRKMFEPPTDPEQRAVAERQISVALWDLMSGVPAKTIKPETMGKDWPAEALGNLLRFVRRSEGREK